MMQCADVLLTVHLKPAWFCEAMSPQQIQQERKREGEERN